MGRLVHHIAMTLATHPRTILAVIAVQSTVVGWQTARYTPEWLAYAPVWVVGACIAGLLCAACSLFPSRFLVAASGAVVIVVAVSRGAALLTQVMVSTGRPTEAMASFVIGTCTWLGFGYLFTIVWLLIVIPWSRGLHVGS